MTINDKQRFVALMMMVADIAEYPASTSKINTYWEVLKEYDIEQVENGFKKLIQTYKYKTFPMPATIIENIVGDPTVLGLDGWNKLEAAISNYGVYVSPVLDDKVLYHTIQRFGGWVQVCLKNRELDDVGFQIFQRDFMRCYQAMAKEPNLSEPTQLVGLCERTNADKGMISMNRIKVALPENPTVKEINQ